MALLGKKSAIAEDDFNDIVEFYVKHILENALKDGPTIQDLMLDGVRDYLAEKKITIDKKNLENMTSIISLYWILAFLIEPYLINSKKHKETELYKIFLERVLARITEISEGSIKKDILLVYAEKQTLIALGSMHSGGPRKMWWDIFLYLEDLDQKIPHVGDAFTDMELATHATGTMKMSLEMAANARKLLTKYSLA